MKKVFSIIILNLVFLGVFAQEGNLGIFAGGAYYNGELNPRSVLYSPTVGLGILYRHNFDYRWSMRIGLNYANLTGSDATSTNSYQLERDHSFSTTVWDIGPQVELNFFKYDKEEYYSHYFTPYISTGFLLSILPDLQKTLEIAVPFSFGFKYAVSQKITAGLEWSYRWSNSDEIDGLMEDDLILNPAIQMSYNPNNDFYNFIGAFITVRVFKHETSCPAFMY